MTLNGNSDETFGYNSVAKNGVNANANFVKSMVPPIGAIISWAKTFDEVVSDTTDGTTTSKLVDTSVDFVALGVLVGTVIHNTTDNTFTTVTAIDSTTILSVADDIFTTGENYKIYNTPGLPDGWVECDGTVLSDSDSPFNGAILPSLNGTTNDTKKFLRGAIASGAAAIPTHLHNVSGSTGGPSGTDSSGSGNAAASPSHTHSMNFSSGSQKAVPTYYEVVFIMRIK